MTLVYDLPWDGISTLTGPTISFDCETELIRQDDPTHVPQIVLATASDCAGKNVVIKPSQLADFIIYHRHLHWVLHNAPFDVAVVDRHLRETSGAAAAVALQWWWDLIDDNRMHDTLILDMLYRLAKGEGEHAGSDEDASAKGFFPMPLDKVAERYAGVKLSKKDEHRLRFAELLPLQENWEGVDRGFFDYAVLDTHACLAAYHGLMEQIVPLVMEIEPQLLPDAICKWGPLTESIQLKGAIALQKITRRGLHFDPAKVRILEDEMRRKYQSALSWVEDNYPSLLKKKYAKPEKGKKRGEHEADVEWEYVLSAKSGTVSMTIPRDLLRDIARKIGIEPPISSGKQGLISASWKAWEEHQEKHAFLKAWGILKTQEKQLSFLDPMHRALASNRTWLHPKYRSLLRTGRCSSYDPNTQQWPRGKDFRALFVPSPGHIMVATDYSFIELRTLAAHCQHRFGHSQLAETIRAGIDPHLYTASMVMKTTLEDLKAQLADEKARKKNGDKGPFPASHGRQAAKALNFGVPGGLGAAKLAEYAQATYGVSMTEQEARTLRDLLINVVYPELEQYLSDRSVATLATNLGMPSVALYKEMSSFGPRLFTLMGQLKRLISGTMPSTERITQPDEYWNNLWKALYRWMTTGSKSFPAWAVEAVRTHKPTPRLVPLLLNEQVTTITGRLRGGCSFTQSRNSPFQGLAADGAKLALWRLEREGFRVVAFVHDEVLVEIPIGPDQDRLIARVQEIMNEEMSQVLGGLVPVASEPEVGTCWLKS